jgi:hypothetical protein
MLRDVFEKLCLPELNPMAMCLELGDYSICYHVGIAEDAPVKVGDQVRHLRREKCIQVSTTFRGMKHVQC